MTFIKTSLALIKERDDQSQWAWQAFVMLRHSVSDDFAGLLFPGPS